ncbi:MAG: iron-sulfur cluster assembly scaffold protein [Caulobacteraceae bacterium]
MIDDLYSSKILRLVAHMPHAGRLAAPDASSEKVSKLCGSKITVDVAMDGDRVSDFAQEVKACALGQAAAAVLGEHIIGASVAEIEQARDQLRAMLKADGPPPAGRFSELSVLSQVKDYPARHASTMLAFEAAAEAARAAVKSNGARTRTAGAA